MKDFFKIVNLLLLLIFSLQDDPSNNYGEIPLNIYFDLFNFNYTFPNDTLGEESKGIFIIAMNNAKDKLKKIFKIDYYTDPVFDNTNNYKNEWNIEWWNETMFNEAFLKLDVYNYIVFFNFFGTIHGEASSRIVYSPDRPSIGVITFNPVKLKLKLSSDYLTTLIFHQLIHLLGFHIDNFDSQEEEIFEGIIIKDEEFDTYYISSEHNILLYDYIRTYFKDPDFDDIIELELDEDNNIHWPKRYFLGDIMTAFDYPEEQALSGFTLAFLEDLGYLHVIKKYTGGLMRFGKNKGSSFLTEKIT